MLATSSLSICMLKLILGGWAASLVASTAFLCAAAGRREVIGGVVTHVLALPILRLPSRAMPPIGCAVMGVLLGFLLVDCCFDLLVLQAGAGAAHDARRAAFAYYHTILNTLHINSVLWIAMLALVLAAARGLQEAQGGGGRVWARPVVQHGRDGGRVARGDAAHSDLSGGGGHVEQNDKGKGGGKRPAAAMLTPASTRALSCQGLRKVRSRL